MNNDINELDVNDEGLKGIFGARFDDGSKPVMAVRRELAEADIPEAEYEECPVDLRKTCKDLGEKLVDFGKRSLVYAIISWLCFYWQGAGLMDPSIAVPAMWICAAAAGWGAGGVALRKE